MRFILIIAVCLVTVIASREPRSYEMEFSKHNKNSDVEIEAPNYMGNSICNQRLCKQKTIARNDSFLLDRLRFLLDRIQTGIYAPRFKYSKRI